MPSRTAPRVSWLSFQHRLGTHMMRTSLDKKIEGLRRRIRAQYKSRHETEQRLFPNVEDKVGAKLLLWPDFYHGPQAKTRFARGQIHIAIEHSQTPSNRLRFP